MKHSAIHYEAMRFPHSCSGLLWIHRLDYRRVARIDDRGRRLGSGNGPSSRSDSGQPLSTTRREGLTSPVATSEADGPTSDRGAVRVTETAAHHPSGPRNPEVKTRLSQRNVRAFARRCTEFHLTCAQFRLAHRGPTDFRQCSSSDGRVVESRLVLERDCF
jgi:hypothetical protein